jgi:hypothetical protein
MNIFRRCYINLKIINLEMELINLERSLTFQEISFENYELERLIILKDINELKEKLTC